MMELKTIEFTEAAVMSYLDHQIRQWRFRRDMAKLGSAERNSAVDHIDALQSMRMALFGSVLVHDGMRSK